MTELVLRTILYQEFQQRKWKKNLFCSLCESKRLYVSVVNVILVRMKFTLS